VEVGREAVFVLAEREQETVGVVGLGLVSVAAAVAVVPRLAKGGVQTTVGRRWTRWSWWLESKIYQARRLEDTMAGWMNRQSDTRTRAIE
jgi:hypothetical protein